MKAGEMTLKLGSTDVKYWGSLMKNGARISTKPSRKATETLYLRMFGWQ